MSQINNQNNLKQQRCLCSKTKYSQSKFIIQEIKKQDFFNLQTKKYKQFKSTQKKQNKNLPHFKRFSVITNKSSQYKKQTNFLSQIKPRMSNYQHRNIQYSNIQLSNQYTQIKQHIPKFIKQRQERKKNSQIVIQEIKKEQKYQQKSNNIEKLLRSGLKEISMTQSLRLEESYHQSDIKQCSIDNKYQQNQSTYQTSKNNLHIVKSCQHISTKQHDNHTTQTQSTISSLRHCLSNKNFFISTLSPIQQKQIKDDFQRIFQSRKQSYELFEDRENVQLTRQFMLLIN